MSLLCRWSYSEVPIMSCGRSSRIPFTLSSQSMMRPFGVSRTTNSWSRVGLNNTLSVLWLQGFGLDTQWFQRELTFFCFAPGFWPVVQLRKKLQWPDLGLRAVVDHPLAWFPFCCSFEGDIASLEMFECNHLHERTRTQQWPRHLLHRHQFWLGRRSCA